MNDGLIKYAKTIGQLTKTHRDMFRLIKQLSDKYYEETDKLACWFNKNIN